MELDLWKLNLNVKSKFEEGKRRSIEGFHG